MSPSRPCAGPTPSQPCPTRALVPAKPGTKQAARCPACTACHQARRGTTTQRGYGTAHQALRAQLLATYQPTDPCPRCGQPLGNDPSKLDLGHRDDRLSYTGLEHADCNRGSR